jgi:hypothetical protein
MIIVKIRQQSKPITGVWRGPDRSIIFAAAAKGPEFLTAVMAVRVAPDPDPGDLAAFFQSA